MALTRKQFLAAVAAGTVALVGLAVPAQAADSQQVVPQSAITDLKQMVKQHDTAYGGLAQYPETRTLVVTLAKQGADPAAARLRVAELTERAASRAAAAEPVWRVEYRTVARTLRDLTTIKDGVPTRQPFAGVAHDRLANWYVDPRTNTVAVGVTQLDSDIVDAARTTYGDAVTLHQADRASKTTRLDDFSPWTAGLRINGSNGLACTGAFAIYHHGVQFMLTAGHCGGLNTNWYNNGIYVGYTDLGFNGRMGYDSAILRGGNYSPTMFTGGNDAIIRSVIGTYDPPIGGATCTSGSFSVSSCANQVVAEDICQGFSDGTTICHLTRADYTGAAHVNLGDSGGPVYAGFGSAVKAVGTIVGANGDSYFYHPIGNLLSLYGATLITS
ncbi:S1 family peptidase [Phytohabitans rumicis]|uniref:Serine protease n=1 Tax=Phytohabitans rumicis TaxID=1076125 RepID=A0A6V8LIT3_9ACTN|nr:S1 family peptidase [Phytohabitans rumicis]GFJ95470.1 serine protease [Phytohabitans rumicis]